jgi:hypothetical protein
LEYFGKSAQIGLMSIPLGKQSHKIFQLGTLQ